MRNSGTLSNIRYLFACVLVFSCAQKKPAEAFGEPISLKTTSDLSGLIVANTESDDVLVQGTVNEVCAKKGCWMTVAAEGSAVRVTFKDYGFFVPKDCSGRTVRMQGRMIEKTLTEAEARHYAEDAGKPTDEIEKIVGDQKTLEFVATGVELI